MSEIDPVEFGRLLAEVRALTAAFEKKAAADDALAERIELLEEQWRLGRMGFIALILGIGAAIFGVKQMLIAVWHAVT